MRPFRWPVMIALGAAVALVVGTSTAREAYRVWQVDQEIKGLEAQVESLQGHRLALMNLVQKLASPDALDLAARGELGLRKPDERVIVLRQADGTPLNFAAAPADAAAAPSQAQVSNVGKWFHYFFMRPSNL